MQQTHAGRMRLAYFVMIVAPLLFSTNMIFGRGVTEQVSPFTLALLRWTVVGAVLSPFIYVERTAIREVMSTHWRLLAGIAFLGMWICGGGVYSALQHTTATNGTLIYTTSPVIILVLEAIFRGRCIAVREGAGAALAFLGVGIIVLRGDITALVTMQFNVGDLVFVAAAVAWAAYSILYRTPDLQRVSNPAMLGLLALFGATLLLPAAVYEWLSGPRLPTTGQAWGNIMGIIVFSSLLAFSAFQFGIRELGATLAGVFMYLMPPYGVLLAVLFLGEDLLPFHLVGIALVMGGVILATFPSGRRP